jgi:hypothetical protein
MAKQIAKLLKASIQETSDLKEIARMLSKKGRGGDTMLAHITPKEAALLKESGGAGTVNPDTGLLEFYDGDFKLSDYADFDSPDYRTGGYQSIPQYSYSPAETGYGFDSVENPDVASPSTFEYTGGYTGGVQTFSDLQNKAAQQYAPTAGTSLYPRIAYQPVSPDDTYEGSPYGASVEFPAGMSARASLPPAGMDFTEFEGIPFGSQAAAPPPPSLVDRALVGPAKKAFEYLKENVTPTEALRLGTAAFGAVQGRRAMQEAQRQREQSVAEQRALGDPYKQMGSELQRQAQSGEMTPQSAQAFQALRAQLAQGVETRGGVGAAQAQAQLEMFRNNLLQNQFNYGLQVSQIGDQIALGAIRTGMQLDRQLLEANQNFYTNLAGFAVGGIPQGQQGRRF